MRYCLPQDWHQSRAIRIPWINAALLQPDEIRYDKKKSNRHKYLMHLPEEDGQAAEFYCAIVRPFRNNEYMFVTAFDMRQPQYGECTDVEPRLYPATEK